MLATRFEDFPESLHPFRGQLEGRSMIVKKAAPLPVECVVRGFLAGSGWKEYITRGTICGQPVPRGYRQAEALPHTMFTPSTKLLRRDTMRTSRGTIAAVSSAMPLPGRCGN